MIAIAAVAAAECLKKKKKEIGKDVVAHGSLQRRIPFYVLFTL